MIRTINLRDIQKIADYYGKEPQLRQTQEECAELTVAINHMLRGKATKEDLINEIADVQIMLAQIFYLYDITSTEIDDKQHEKLTRQLERIETEKKDKLSLPTGLQITLNCIKDMHIALDSLANELVLSKIPLTEEKNETKTRLEDFLAKYPNTLLNEDGRPEDICADDVYNITESGGCSENITCVECWNRPLEKESNN